MYTNRNNRGNRRFGGAHGNHEGGEGHRYGRFERRDDARDGWNGREGRGARDARGGRGAYGSQEEHRRTFRRFSDNEESQEGRRFRRRGDFAFDSERKGARARREDQTERGGYDPNAKYSKKKQLAYKQKMLSQDDPIRLNRFLAQAGICSRREADELISAGVVTVNGKVVTEMGVKVVPSKDKVMFHDQPVRSQKFVYILLNKPKDCVTTMDDPQARITVMDIVKNACSERVYPVGRLDRNTTGVLLLTNDGDLAMKLTHPRYGHQKVYQVGLDKPLSAHDLQQIADGLTLEDGPITVDEISYVNPSDHSEVGIEIHSGRNRIVRRIFESLGYEVKKLDRVVFAGLTKKNLPRGKYRFLSPQEVGYLRMAKSKPEA